MTSRKQYAESIVKGIGANNIKYSIEEKIRIVMEGILGEIAISEFCLQEDIDIDLYYKWSKDIMEAEKGRLSENIKDEDAKSEIQRLKNENMLLRQLVGDIQLEVQMLKKRLNDK